MIADNKYKEVAEEYGTCVKYGMSIKDNAGYNNAFSKYGNSQLAKKQI